MLDVYLHVLVCDRLDVRHNEGRCFGSHVFACWREEGKMQLDHAEGSTFFPVRAEEVSHLPNPKNGSCNSRFAIV